MEQTLTAPTQTIIGTRPPRPDGVDKVTGRAVYGVDVRMSGMLHGKVLRSPHAHARILSIDTSAAEKLPGVKAVVTEADFPDILVDDFVSSGEEGEGTNLKYQSANILAMRKALYHGHAIAAVAAVSPHVAEEALALIKVDYEILPPLLDVRDAIKPGAPILHDDLRTDEDGQKKDGPTNVAKHEQYQRGNLDEGFAQAAHIVEREFVTAMVHQGYIEPQNGTAVWNADGQITIWCSTQNPWGVRRVVSDILSVPIAKIKVIPTEIGGGFGGKLDAYLEPVAAALSKKAGGKPVKLTMSRAEVLMATGPTSGSVIRVKMGCDASGKITAAKCELLFEAGAFPGSPVGAAMGVILGPYRLENLLIDGYDIVVNKPATKAYRAPGGTNAAFASEVVIDELAAMCGLDPLAFRAINGAKEGDRRPDGPIYKRIGFLETVEAARASAHWNSPKGTPNGRDGASKKRGRGVAGGFWFNWGGKSSMSAAVNPDGSVSLSEGSVDIGGTRASIAMQFAETLGIAYACVRPAVVDTDAVGYNDATGGSRTTYGSGWAAAELAKKVRDAMIERAAKHFECEPSEVTYERGVFTRDGSSISFDDLAEKLDDVGGPVFCSASVDARGGAPGLATHIVDVDVDIETGKTEIVRYTAVQDVGKAIHPSYVEGQIHGGVAQGVGWALNEEYFYDRDGHLLNASLLDYRMPTALDLPMIETVLIEVPSPGHPFGVRGVGEVPIVPPAGAIANAIHDALGVRMTELPMNPAKVLKALAA